MSNYGKRMVKENLIKQVATKAEVQASIDSNLAVFKEVEKGDFLYTPFYDFSKLPAEFDTLADYAKYVPYIKTNSLTAEDAAALEAAGYTVIDTDVNLYTKPGEPKLIRFKGVFKLRNSSTQTDYYFGTMNSNQFFTTTDNSIFGEYLIERVGNNGVDFKGARNTGTVTDNDGTITVQKISRSNFYGDIALSSTDGSIQAAIMVRINKPKANANLAVTVPTSEGSYLLKAVVDSNGECASFAWVAESDYKNPTV